MPSDEFEPPAMLHGMPTWLLSQSSLRAHRLLSEALAEVGARGYHVRLLAALAEFGPGSQAALSRRTMIDRSDVVAGIDELAAHGYVRRSPDPDDRRRNLVSITPRGLRHYERLVEVVSGVQDELLAPLNQAERRQLIALLHRVVGA
jgi:DNA-binding MarR family transcriptional regulator